MLPGAQGGVTILGAAVGIVLTIAADTTNYNIRTALLAAGWDGISPTGWTLTVNSGIYVRATTTSNKAIATGAPLPAGSGPFLLVNHGILQSKGGEGGHGATASLAATNGAPGGDVLDIEYDIMIDNTDGYFRSGGGGGGGGGKGSV